MKKTNLIGTLCLGAALLVSTALLTNCKKKEKDVEPTPAPAPAPTPAPPTNTQKLTGKNFKLTALTVDPAIGGISNLYAQMQDCEKDDLTRFDTPNIYKEDEGGTKCNTNDPQTQTGTWTWNTAETVITVTMDSENLDYTVITNDGTTLKVSYTEEIQGINYVVTATLVKQ